MKLFLIWLFLSASTCVMAQADSVEYSQRYIDFEQRQSRLYKVNFSCPKADEFIGKYAPSLFGLPVYLDMDMLDVYNDEIRKDNLARIRRILTLVIFSKGAVATGAAIKLNKYE